MSVRPVIRSGTSRTPQIRKADPRLHSGDTPLIDAVRRECFEEVETLLSRKYTVTDGSATNGDTALMIAARIKWLHGVELLVESGRKLGIDKQNDRGQTAYDIAVSINAPAAIQRLVAKVDERPVIRSMGTQPLADNAVIR